MKILSRDFTRGEKALLLLLALVLVGMVYYFLVDRPVRNDLASAKAEKEAIQTELTALQLQIAKLEQMQAELESIQANPQVSRMGSYNNNREELAFLNDILDGTEDYTVTFSGVTRDGDQIRRNFSLRFTVSSYAAMERVIKQIYSSELRCLIDDINYSRTRVYYNTAERLNHGADYRDVVTVNATATFFETMVGGTPDAGLPQSGKAAS